MILLNNDILITEVDFFNNNFNIDECRISVISNYTTQIIDSTVKYIWNEENIELTKIFYIKILNDIAKNELSNFDWKVIRHKEQLELGIETSLTASDYHDLLEQKQLIRDKVNYLEQQVDACLTIDEINNIKWNKI